MQISNIKNLFLRIAARSIVSEVQNGTDIDKVLENYPGLSDQQIKMIKSLDELK